MPNKTAHVLSELHFTCGYRWLPDLYFRTKMVHPDRSFGVGLAFLDVAGIRQHAAQQINGGLRRVDPPPEARQHELGDQPGVINMRMRQHHRVDPPGIERKRLVVELLEGL